MAQGLASNRLVSIEDISEDELKVLQKYYKHLAAKSTEELSLKESHSLVQANAHHERKHSSKNKGNKIKQM